jgi:CheY-like chemotaxis protein
MDGAGRLTFSLFPAVVGEGHPAQLPPGTYAAIAVTDTGVGMDEATLQRATEPFFTTKGPGRGTGLGLSMAKGLAQQSDGELLVESAPGQGTTVTILLPRTEEVPRPAPAAPPGEILAQDALTILLVDDEPLVRDSVARLLGELGHEVSEASSGAEALDWLRERRPDLIVTDYAMPGMTGTVLAAAARDRWPELPVLLLSGFAALAGMEGGTLPCLAKPCSLAQLAEALDRALAMALRQGLNPERASLRAAEN